MKDFIELKTGDIEIRLPRTSENFKTIKAYLEQQEKILRDEQNDLDTQERSTRSEVRSILETLSKTDKQIPTEELQLMASDEGISEEKLSEIIESLKREGTIFEPKKGFIQLI